MKRDNVSGALGYCVRGLATVLAISAVAAALLGGCGAGSAGSAGSASSLSDGTPPPTNFRSYHVPVFTTANSIDCTTLRGTTASSKRPMCGATVWNSLTTQCLLQGARTGAGINCQCYEGQAHACTPPTGSTACPSGTGCGIRACLVLNDTSSLWSTTCYPL
jgi:hypothetical protein